MMTRETWMVGLTEGLRDLFTEQGAAIPAVHLSVGFPSKGATAMRKRRIGECWGPANSADGRPHIFVSPLIDDGVKAGGVLVHELVHASVGVQHGHRAPFARLARAVGLIGKMTATEESDALKTRLNAIIAAIGPYPHAALTFTGNEKKQSTRLIKIYCDVDDYVLRGSRKTIAMGVPDCPCCGAALRVAGADDEETGE